MTIDLVTRRDPAVVLEEARKAAVAIKSVIDAKLVTPGGLALTLATEMLTNEGHDVFDKQDSNSRPSTGWSPSCARAFRARRWCCCSTRSMPTQTPSG